MADSGRVSFTSALRVGEFRALWVAELFSIAGDQLARVALSLLVFARTSSAALTALTYALTFVPSVLGGVLLSGLADRYPRRAVLVVTDLVRAVLAGLMALPGIPLPVLWACVGLLSMAAGPFKAAQLALLPQILRGEQYTAGLALRQFTGQTAQLVGFAGGGVLLTVVEPHSALGLNAATFVASALVVVAGVRARPASAAGAAEEAKPVRAGRPGGRLGVLYAVVCLIGLYVVPEGVAAPYAHELGTAAIGVGLLMAADPLGSALGAWLTTRIRIPTSLPAIVSLAAVAGVPLAVCGLRPGLVVSVVLWAVSGAVSTAYLIQTQAMVVDLVPDERRGRVMGRMATCLYASQGVAILAGGVVAEVVGPFRAVAGAGLGAIVLALVIGAVRPRRVAGGEPAVPSQKSLLRMDSTSSQGTDCVAHPDADSAAGEPGDASAPSMDAPRVRGGVAGWTLWTVPARAVVYLLGIEALALALTAVIAVVRPVTSRDLVYFGVIVVLGLVAAEATRHIEQMRRRFSDTPHVNMSSVWTVAASMVTAPALAAATAAVLYLHLWWRSWRHVSGVYVYRTVFNVCAVSLSCYSAAALLAAVPVEHPLSMDQPIIVLGLVVVIVTYWVVNSGLVASAIAFAQGDRSLRRVLGSWSENALECATLCLGMITAMVLAWRPWAVVLVLPPLYVLARSVLIRQLEHAATTDGKTGLLNAASWQSLAAKELDRARRHGTHVGLLMLDLDHFKRVNDNFSHLFGDQVLRTVADTIRQQVRGYDLCGRFGGEEFVVLLPGTSIGQAEEIGDRICAAVRTLRVDDPTTGLPLDSLRLSVSIGAAAHPDHGQDLDDVLLAADNALFNAKDAGRDQVRAVQVRNPGS